MAGPAPHRRQILLTSEFEVQSAPPLMAGDCNRLWRVLLEDGSAGLAKSPVLAYLGPRTDYILAGNEQAASVVADLMGWPDLVAPAVRRWWDGEGCWISLQDLWPPSMRVIPRVAARKARDADGIRLAVFDYLILNQDRHAGNVLVTEREHLRAIDHELAFVETTPNPDSLYTRENLGRAVPAPLLRAVERLLGAETAELNELVGRPGALGVLRRARHLVDAGQLPATEPFDEAPTVREPE